MKNISAAELFQALADGGAPLLIDVRQPEELAFGTLPESLLFPLQDLTSRLKELQKIVKRAGKKKKIIVFCRFGGRSESAIRYLEGIGFPEMYNLQGGTNGYAELDECVSPY